VLEKREQIEVFHGNLNRTLPSEKLYTACSEENIKAKIKLFLRHVCTNKINFETK
jgi:hypothetical protein